MKKITRRNLKTLALALFAITAFIWACLFTLEIPQKTVLNYFLMSCTLIALLIGAAFLGMGLMTLLKNRFKK